MKRDPIAATRPFRAVMTAAAWRCQCTGACGQPHAQSDGRCPREHDSYAGKHGGPISLIAAPADPRTPARQAVALSAGELRAWCPTCHSAANRPLRAPEAAQGGLFDL
jgi:hypothetical protein